MYRTEGEVIRGTSLSIIVIQTRPLANVDALIGGKENKKSLNAEMETQI